MMEEFERNIECELSEEELEKLNGGIGFGLSRKKKPLHAGEEAAVTLKHTNTTCPRCHCYREMSVSGAGILTCSCGHSWQVFL